MPKGRHFGSQNGTKIDPKTSQNRSRFSRAKKHSSRTSWNRLEAILSRSWGLSWVIFLILAGVLQWFREHQRFGTKRGLKMRLGAILADLGGQEGPKGRPKGTQEAPKTRLKRHQNFERFLARFWTDLGGPGDPGATSWRNARGLARLFEFEEFEQEFEEDFENCLDTLRPFGWRRI